MLSFIEFVVKITIFFEKRYLKYNDAYASIRVSKDKDKNQQNKKDCEIKCKLKSWF